MKTLICVTIKGDLEKLENDFLDGIYDPFGEGTLVASPVVRSPSPKRSRFRECIKVQNINMSHMLNITDSQTGDGDEGSCDEESGEGISTGGNGAGSSTGGVDGDKGTGRRVKGRAKKVTKKNQKEPGEKKGMKKNQKEPGELNLNIMVCT